MSLASRAEVVALVVLGLALGSGCGPRPLATGMPADTRTPLPTATATRTPRVTPTPTATSRPTSTPTPSETPVPTATPDPIPDRKTYDCHEAGFSIDYPGAWYVGSSTQGVSFGDMSSLSTSWETGRSVHVSWGLFGPGMDGADDGLYGTIDSFPDWTWGEVVAFNLSGEAAFRATYYDPDKDERGVRVCVGHGGRLYIIRTRVAPARGWSREEALFWAMLWSFRFWG
jgi:hypothetical protein